MRRSAMSCWRLLSIAYRTVAPVALLAAAYVLSAGPVAALFGAGFIRRGSIPHDAFEIFYAPLGVARNNSPGCRRALDGYVGAWQSFGRDVRAPVETIGRIVAILLVAAVLAVIVLGTLEALHLAWWKLRKCPSCKRRWAFPGWNSAEWHSRHDVTTDELNGESLESPVEAIACPHCGFQIKTREAAHF